MGKTTILVENKTRELLRTIGRKNQTYDQLINELIAMGGRKYDSLENEFDSLQPSESMTRRSRADESRSIIS